MQKKSAITWRLIGALLLSMTTASLAADRTYEAALDRYFELTYGQQLDAIDVDQLVDDFRTKLSDKPQAQSCPALKTALGEFAEHEFRNAVDSYFHSQELEGQIKGVLRARLTREDMDAFIAFASTPAGAAYVRNSQAADGEVRAALKASREQMLASPVMKKLMSDMGAKLLPVMVECQS